MKISVFGMGYVGSVTAACLAKNGHSVIGTDIKHEKVEAINLGTAPVFEKGLDTLISEAVANGKLEATVSPEEAIKNSEISLICVGTPSEFDGSLNTKYIKKVCSDIGRALKGKNEFHVIAIRSTVLPGTTEKLLIPTIENESMKKAFMDFGVCVNPEFMREGEAIYDFFNADRIVIGDGDKNSGDIVEKIYQDLKAPIIRVDIKSAEMIKYVENSFHGMKVAFANEIGTLCKKVGIDGREIMKIFCMDQKLNLSPYYFRPGFAFGGSCIPKDLRAILYKSKELEMDCPLIGSILDSNQKHIDRAVELIMQQEKKKIGIFGLTFKCGTSDTRESPAIPLVSKLLEKGYLKLFEKGYAIQIYDSNINPSEINEILPHFAPLINLSFESIIEESEVLVIAKNEDLFKKIPLFMKKDNILIDLVGVINQRDITKGKYIGICW